MRWRPLALAGLGLLLVFAAPAHRLDLSSIGLAALVGGVLWWPRAGAVLIGAALPLFFFSRQLLGPLSVTPPGLVLILTWLAALARAQSARLRWPRTPFDAPLALLLVAALLSLVVTEYPLLSVRELRALILEPVLFFWLLYALPGSARLAVYGFLSTATLGAAVAIAQLPTGVGGTQAEGVRRAQAWYPSANHLALMLGRAWPWLLAAAIVRWRRAWLPALVVGCGLVVTFSTGGFIGAAAASVAVVAKLKGRTAAFRLAGIAALLIVLVSATALVGILPERLNPLRQTGGFRIDLWLSSLEMIRDHFLLGVGLDNFVYLYQQQYLREGAAAEPNLSHPHNWVFHVWLELGLAGLIAFLWLLWTCLRRAWQASGWLVAGALGALADTLVHGAIDNSYFLVDLAFLFWLTLAVTANDRIDAT